MSANKEIEHMISQKERANIQESSVKIDQILNKKLLPSEILKEMEKLENAEFMYQSALRSCTTLIKLQIDTLFDLVKFKTLLEFRILGVQRKMRRISESNSFLGMDKLWR